jgi:uncharacterized protein YggT (Ycf19 family)
MPTSVRVAVIVMAVQAALLLLVTALNLYVLEQAVGRIADSQGVARSDAERVVLFSLGPYLVLGLLFALSAWFVPRRHAWARWLGLASAALVATLTALSAVGDGGVTVLTLLLFVLSLATITSLAARTTSSWVPRLRART